MQGFASRRAIPAFSARHALTVIGTLRNIPPFVSKRYTDIAGRMVPGLMAHSFRSDVGQCLTVQALSNGSRSCDDPLQTCLSCAISGTSFAGSACSLPGYMHDVRFVGVSQHRLLFESHTIDIHTVQCMAKTPAEMQSCLHRKGRAAT